MTTARPELLKAIKLAKAPAWRPAPGDTFTGKLAGIRIGDNGDYGPYPVVVFKNVDDDGYTAVHAFHTLLRDGLLKLAPKMDDEVSIHYVGEVEKNSSATAFNAGLIKEKDREFYHDYVVFGAEVDNTVLGWDQVESLTAKEKPTE
jgi:hypothetical protein